jgi:hypothetical protein
MAAAQMAFDFARGRSAPGGAAREPRVNGAREPRSGGARDPRDSGQVGLIGAQPAPRPRVPEGAERILKERELEQRLSRLLSTQVVLHLTDNGRTMLSARDRDGVAHVRLHHMFMNADDGVLRSLARFLREGSAAAGAQLQRFIRDHGEAIRRRARVAKVRARGHHHDLRAILEEVGTHYFQVAPDVRIGWARMGRPLVRRKRRSIKLGSYRGRDTLIRVHPVLDAAWVPRFFVEYIVYHELLHHVLGMPVRNGRRNLHGPEFRARERCFARYDEAIAWEQRHLDRLLSG